MITSPSKITIYGKDGCVNCKQARKVLAGSEYYTHDRLFDHYEQDQAIGIIENSGGDLPIIICEGLSSLIQLKLSAASSLPSSQCEDGSCNI